MQHLPIYLYVIFCTTVLLSIGFFYKAAGYSKSFLTGLLAYTAIQSLLGVSGFYEHSSARFPLLIAPPLLFLISRLVTRSGRAFLNSLNLPTLTLFHVIRVPVELVLFGLFVHQAVPAAMTFEGRNFDIISGITAPFVYYWGFVKRKLISWVMIAWNVVCLLLLLNIVSSAILSLPDRYQQYGFEQPNIALGYIPFVLLPALLVPLVVLATFAAISQLLKK